MFRGFNTVASGMIAQQRRTELLTNNMANANTPGFKADQSTIRSFPEMLMSRLGPTQIPTKDPISGKYDFCKLVQLVQVCTCKKQWH